MATTDDKIGAAVDQSQADMTDAFKADLNLLLQVLSAIIQAMAGLETLHPMAPAALGPALAKAKAALAKLTGG